MVGFPEMEATQRQRFVQIIAEESQALSRTIDAALSEYADAIKASMALEDMRAADLITVARPRMKWTTISGCGWTASRWCSRSAISPGA